MEKFKINKDEIGIDEAGRGPFFGPVYAAAVIWGNAPDNELIKDSKKLSKKRRKESLVWIHENIDKFGIGFCTSAEIDHFGILDATKIAMERAVQNIDSINSNNKILLIDGIGWDKKKFNIPLDNYIINPIIKGDSKYRNIAAASILAKEAHDEHILKICDSNMELNEKYDLLSNKGYGTKKHIEGIKKYGLTSQHRQSFYINYR